MIIVLAKAGPGKAQQMVLTQLPRRSVSRVVMNGKRLVHPVSIPCQERSFFASSVSPL